MDQELRRDTADVLAGVGRHWGWVLAFGIVTLLAGLLALAWPGRTIVVIAVLFGIQLVVAGVFRFVAALASDDESGGTRVLLALLGVLSFIVGLYALRNVLVTIAALALLFLGYTGLGISLWPNVIPPDISIWQAAGPPQRRPRTSCSFATARRKP